MHTNTKRTLRINKLASKQYKDIYSFNVYYLNYIFINMVHKIKGKYYLHSHFNNCLFRINTSNFFKNPIL